MSSRCPTCGSEAFRVRANGTQQVGLATCEQGHHALLLDSRDVWTEVIQEGRPKAVKCRCKGDTFRLSFAYERDDERVRGAAVHAHCTACGKERTVYAIEVDYEPTDELVERPLDPIGDPWKKARWVQLTAVWKRADLLAALPEDAWMALERWNERPRVIDLATLARELHSERAWRLYVAPGPVELPEDRRKVYRRAPVIEVSTISMNWEGGSGVLYYLEWALEELDGDRVVPRDPSFLAFTERFRARLAERFVSTRGKHCYDAPAEYRRLFG